ncbi:MULTISPECIES: VWA domain-containing protein [unclassified Ruegeria]|uniref:vWA domain-containing protein n=1 Tax=unclassified Ruegeria TaxID=2625375 RepID=UPI001ADC7EEA|nr:MULTISPECIES: VWA domain-containing protein [unclassified Ruegeria]MBO9412569.1 VWA domain-containing protein [Ruegeria sp. R8_1]MBO9416193.1 VWA domain-containing protein [Ruegeria sp. R8_2]
MTDDLEQLKKVMDVSTPGPDATRRAANMELAQKNFVALQGSSAQDRPTVRRGPLARVTKGAKSMLNALSHRGLLTATTAVAAVALVVVLPQTRDYVPNPTSWKQVQSDAPQNVVAEAEDALGNSEPVYEAPVLAELAAPLTESRNQRATGQKSVVNGNSLTADEGGSTPSELSRLHGLSLERDTEAFATAETNPLKITADDPVSTFSIDVDTASYSIVRSSLLNGKMPPRDAVRIEEMINYFPYAYPLPEDQAPFRPSITVSPTPWNDGTQLVHVAIQGTMPVVEERPPLNLVFLIDTSGSMQDANKLPLLKKSFRLMLAELRPEDQVSIVTYAGSAGQVLEPTFASDQGKILAALQRLEAGGSTAGQAGLQQAYEVAETMSAEGEVTRVLLATDGDFNVGMADPEALRDFIARKRDSGTYLSVLGFGRGNLDDEVMQTLAQNGNGQAAYIDTLSEARKILVDQLTGALFPIANDVKIQVEFNPAQIAEYRLIGYETRSLRREDFANDKVDAGDIGAGHSVTAIYEVTPVGSEAIRNEPLRYADSVVSDASDEIGYLKLRFKAPGSEESQLIQEPIFAGQGDVTKDIGFSYAIAGFGQLLRRGLYLNGWSYDEAIALASTSRGDDPFGYRSEAVTLMRLAQSLER